MCPLIGPVFEKLFTFSQPFLTLQLPEPHQDLWNGRRRGGNHKHIIYNEEAVPTKENTAEWEGVHHMLIKNI
jgi:hypothetical protein